MQLRLRLRLPLRLRLRLPLRLLLRLPLRLRLLLRLPLRLFFAAPYQYRCRFMYMRQNLADFPALRHLVNEGLLFLLGAPRLMIAVQVRTDRLSLRHLW